MFTGCWLGSLFKELGLRVVKPHAMDVERFVRWCSILWPPSVVWQRAVGSKAHLNDVYRSSRTAARWVLALVNYPTAGEDRRDAVPASLPPGQPKKDFTLVDLSEYNNHSTAYYVFWSSICGCHNNTYTIPPKHREVADLFQFVITMALARLTVSACDNLPHK